MRAETAPFQRLRAERVGLKSPVLNHLRISASRVFSHANVVDEKLPAVQQTDEEFVPIRRIVRARRLSSQRRVSVSLPAELRAFIARRPRLRLRVVGVRVDEFQRSPAAVRIGRPAPAVAIPHFVHLRAERVAKLDGIACIRERAGKLPVIHYEKSARRNRRRRRKCERNRVVEFPPRDVHCSACTVVQFHPLRSVFQIRHRVIRVRKCRVRVIENFVDGHAARDVYRRTREHRLCKKIRRARRAARRRARDPTRRRVAGQSHAAFCERRPCAIRRSRPIARHAILHFIHQPALFRAQPDRVARAIETADKRPQRTAGISSNGRHHNERARLQHRAIGESKIDAARDLPAAEIQPRSKLIYNLHPIRRAERRRVVVDFIKSRHTARRTRRARLW